MSKNYSPLKSALCSVIGHNFKVYHTINERVQELRCTNCHKQMTRNIYGKVVPLDDRYTQINRAIDDMARKRKKQV
ncbi:MAG: hypothetical protein ABF274_05255 [Nonlabens sp.]|uniref:hypothetical protein n=1 Tax=Nonlabens sp. TaxID=1888209 RepID=UPI00321B8533